MTRYTKSELVMQDPAVKQAIRLLQVRGVTLNDIEKAYRYFDRLKVSRKAKGEVTQ